MVSFNCCYLRSSFCLFIGPHVLHYSFLLLVEHFKTTNHLHDMIHVCPFIHGSQFLRLTPFQSCAVPGAPFLSVIHICQPLFKNLSNWDQPKWEVEAMVGRLQKGDNCSGDVCPSPGSIFTWLCLCALSPGVELDTEQLDGVAAQQPSQGGTVICSSIPHSPSVTFLRVSSLHLQMVVFMKPF